MSPEGFPGFGAVPESEPESGVEEEAPSSEETPAEAAPTGVDVSTAPPTAPAPNPGVPSQPVNAVTNPGELPAARLDESRIGEALRAPEAESPPAETAEEG